MALTYTNFQALYPTSTLTQATVESLILLYKSQLQNYFRFDNLPKTKFIDIDFCGQSKVYLKQPLILQDPDTIVVEEVNKKTRMLTTLAVEVDFLYQADTIIGQEYIYALDFECMGCNCKCDQLKITGLWGLELPEYIENVIYSHIETQSSKISESCQDIASEKLGSRSVVYRKADTPKSVLDINNILTIPTISQLILQIQSHFLYV